MARAAEETGFDSLWVGDHLLYRGDGRSERGPWDCWTVLAWLAGDHRRGSSSARSSRAPRSARPALLARTAAAVRRAERRPAACRARLRAGTRTSSARSGSRSTTASRASRRRSTIVRRLLAGERVTFDGPLPRGRRRGAPAAARATPPLMVGGERRRGCSSIDAAARRLRGTPGSSRFGNRPTASPRSNARIDEACERAGRDPATLERSACVLVAVDGGAGERPRDSRRAAAPRRRAAVASSRRWRRRAPTRRSSSLDPITEPSIRSLRTALPSA